jgi:hypothetical protein
LKKAFYSKIPHENIFRPRAGNIFLKIKANQDFASGFVAASGLRDYA